ncbi:hypothetical protein SPHS8_00863 [Sphingobium sp. S8]|nr:hypothetical protein SPHS8_00863 [Sphingobium sp. S8]
MMAKTARGASRRTAAAPAPEPAKAKEGVQAPAKSGKVRWLRMETGLSGPEISLARGDKHPFCDVPGDDDAPSEAQRLVDAGFAVDCDPPAEG